MMIEVTGKSTTQVIRRLRGIPEIRTLHTTNGNWDLIADINAAGLSDFDRVLREVRTIDGVTRSEEHTSELQSLMRISYAVFCLKKKNTQIRIMSSKITITLHILK